MHMRCFPHWRNQSIAVGMQGRWLCALNRQIHAASRMQEDFLAEYELPIKACQTFQSGTHASASAVDYYEDQFTSVRNLMCQLNSLATVTAMWRETKREYDAVLYLRPDVLYNCPFPVERLDAMEDGKVCGHDWGTAASHTNGKSAFLWVALVAQLWLQWIAGATCTRPRAHGHAHTAVLAPPWSVG